MSGRSIFQIVSFLYRKSRTDIQMNTFVFGESGVQAERKASDSILSMRKPWIVRNGCAVVFYFSIFYCKKEAKKQEK